MPSGERQALSVTAYDLDLHLNQITGEASVHARVMVRNDSSQALVSLPMQISSAMTWQSARAAGKSLALRQHSVDTDADHTGAANEALLPLPLAVGASVELDLFYGGSLAPSAERLTRIGAPEGQALASDWDGFGKSPVPAVAGVRGFGNVMWYPVAAAPVFLGKGNALFSAVGEQRLRQRTASFHLRLTLEYGGTAPDAAFFSGVREPLLPLEASASQDTAPANTSSFATATWTLPALGFRTPSLFIAVPSATETSNHLVQVVTDRADTVVGYSAAAALAQPLLVAWLGPSPLQELTLLDLGTRAGSPFEEGSLLALPLSVADPERSAPTMVHGLTHAWFHSEEAWLAEGLATFMEQLWTERMGGPAGREAAITSAEPNLRALALYESVFVADEKGISTSTPAERPPLTACGNPICYRTKAATVFQMLREIVGEDALKLSLQAMRSAKTQDAASFEALLEKTSGKDLEWFFEDWVLHDRGLPDLSIVNVAPRSVAATNASTAGHGATETTPTGQQVRTEGGWLTAVAVANDGGAAAEVPVTLRTGAFTTVERLRIPAHGRATVRILTPSQPEEVTVNDGVTPELRSSLHERRIAGTP